MARETKAARDRRYADLLADYRNRSDDLNKLMAIVKGLKAQVEDIPPGTYGDWIRAEGRPRVITDPDALRALLEKHGLEVPTKTTKAPVVVTPKPR